MSMSSETSEGAGIKRHESEAADPDTDEQHVRHGMPPLQFGQGLATGIATGGIKIPCGFPVPARSPVPAGPGLLLAVDPEGDWIRRAQPCPVVFKARGAVSTSCGFMSPSDRAPSEHHCDLRAVGPDRCFRAPRNENSRVSPPRRAGRTGAVHRCAGVPGHRPQGRCHRMLSGPREGLSAEDRMAVS